MRYRRRGPSLDDSRDDNDYSDRFGDTDYTAVSREVTAVQGLAR